MGKLKVTDLFFYRWRYMLGFTSLLVASIVLISLAVWMFPGGISESEQQSVVTSSRTMADTFMGNDASHIVNAPYYLGQHIVLAVAGMSSQSIKLLSALLAFFGALCYYGVIRLWFRRNVAIISSAILITSGQFLLLSQLGTPDILLFFWPSAILFSTSMLAYAKRFQPIWIFVSAALAAISLYTPLSIYLLAALAATCLLHPHARFTVFSQRTYILAGGGVLFALLTIPLVISIVKQPDVISILLGTNHASFSLETIWSNLSPLVMFQDAQAGLTLQPIFGLTTILIAIIGAIHLFTAKYTAKSYILSLIFIMLIFLLALGIFSAAFLVVPVMLLVAFGFNYLIRNWYKLFPFNPYARVLGLLPLSVLILSVAFSNLERYILSYHYLASSMQTFSRDLSLIDSSIDQSQKKDIVLVVAANSKDFYTVYANTKPHTATVSVETTFPINTTKTIISIPEQADQTLTPSNILVTPTEQHAARFYVYKNNL